MPRRYVFWKQILVMLIFLTPIEIQLSYIDLRIFTLLISIFIFIGQKKHVSNFIKIKFWFENPTQQTLQRASNEWLPLDVSWSTSSAKQCV